MSLKNIEKEVLNLKTVFLDLKNIINTLASKCVSLEKRLKKQKKFSFKCKRCSEKFETVDDLKKHKKDENSCKANFECDDCEKTFDTEKALNIHTKTHEKYACEECEDEFNFERTLDMHISAVHGSMKLYCHYFNNDKECPYSDQCIYAHEESPDCKFGNACERMLCMFQHEDKEESDDEEDAESEDDDEHEENDVDITDLEPSLKKVAEALEKVTDLLRKQTSPLKCNFCDFEAKNQNGLTMHMKSKHGDKSK